MLAVLKWAGLAFCAAVTAALFVRGEWTIGDDNGAAGRRIVRLSAGDLYYFTLGPRDVRGAAWQGTRVPLWMPLAAGAAVTAWSWRAHSRRRRPGHCRACGYDLGKPPYSLICPGCGRERR